MIVGKCMDRTKIGLLAAWMVLGFPLGASAASGTFGSMTNADRGLVIACAFMVFLMQGGFCMLELGFSRAKNSINVIMKSLLGFSLTAIVFLVGFTFMFGNSVNGWLGMGGWDYLFAAPANADLWVFWMFQVMLVGIAGTIASGAMAERTRFIGYLCYVVVLAGVIYPVLGHWAWGSLAGNFGLGGDQGWLEARLFHDFAGGTVVHGVGGACALAGLLAVGPRRGRFAADGTARLIVGHNLPLAALGAFLLWFGWLGLHVGAHGNAGPEIGMIAVNTTVAPAFGALSAMISRWVVDGRPDGAITLNGALAGLVAISAGCDVVAPFAALAIGTIGGLVATFGSILLEKLRLDDTVDAVPVHLFAGIWGSLAVGLFYKGESGQVSLVTQAIGSFGVCLAAFVFAFVAFKMIDLVIGLRAGDEDQEDGLDFAEHAANAYPDFVTTDQD